MNEDPYRRQFFIQLPKLSSSQNEQLSNWQICGGNASWCRDTSRTVRVRTLFATYVCTTHDNNRSYFILQFCVFMVQTKATKCNTPWGVSPFHFSACSKYKQAAIWQHLYRSMPTNAGGRGKLPLDWAWRTSLMTYPYEAFLYVVISCPGAVDLFYSQKKSC